MKSLLSLPDVYSGAFYACKLAHEGETGKNDFQHPFHQGYIFPGPPLVLIQGAETKYTGPLPSHCGCNEPHDESLLDARSRILFPLAFRAKCCRVSSRFCKTCPSGLGSQELYGEDNLRELLSPCLSWRRVVCCIRRPISAGAAQQAAVMYHIVARVPSFLQHSAVFLNVCLWVSCLALTRQVWQGHVLYGRRWPFGIFHFRDALFGFTSVFRDCGDFGLWGSGWGSLWVFSVRAGVRAYGVFLLFAVSVPCRAPGLRRVCSLLLPRVSLLCPRRPLLGPRRLWRSRRARALSRALLL